MTRRHLLPAVAVAGGLVLLVAPAAFGASDLYSNIGPGGSVSGLADRYPIGNYALDQHFDAIKASLTGGVDASGIPSMIAFFLANLIWQITAFIANAVIVIFGYAFSLDLLNGSTASGGTGALAPVGQAIGGLYAHTFGEPWAIVAITLTGCWAMWRALIQRRYTETAAALGKSLMFCLIALAIVSRPDATIGEASRWTNQISTAFLSVTTHGDVTTGRQARRSASDELFSTLILGPWVALNFGGTEHCIHTGTGSKDSDPISVPVRPLAPGPGRRLNASTGIVSAGSKECVSNTGRYPAHFLAYPPGSDDRDAEYQAINHGDPTKLPDSDPAKKTGSYVPAVIDKPATDAMEKGGQYQRLLLALVVLVCELGAFMLLGSLAVSVVLSQIVVLLLACFAPVALVAGIIPGRGHDLFGQWATHLAAYLVRKAAYSLVLAVVLAVLSALQEATSNLGWLMSFGLQAALLWTVFLQRHTLVGKLTTAISAQQPGREAQLSRLLGIGVVARSVTPARRRPTPGAASARQTPDHEATPDTAPAAAAPASFQQPADPARVRLTASPRPRPRRDRSETSPAAVTLEHAAVGAGADGPASHAGHRRSRSRRTVDEEPGRTHTDPDATAAAVAPLPRRPSRPAATGHPARRPDRQGDHPGTPLAQAVTPRDAAAPSGPSTPTAATLDAADHAAAPPPPEREDAASEPSLADQLRSDRQRLTPQAPQPARDLGGAMRRPPPMPSGDECGAPETGS